jgi:hypothetical protein
MAKVTKGRTASATLIHARFVLSVLFAFGLKESARVACFAAIVCWHDYLPRAALGATFLFAHAVCLPALNDGCPKELFGLSLFRINARTYIHINTPAVYKQ